MLMSWPTVIGGFRHAPKHHPSLFWSPEGASLGGASSAGAVPARALLISLASAPLSLSSRALLLGRALSKQVGLLERRVPVRAAAGPRMLTSAAVRVGGKAFGHDDGAEERPQEVERPEGVTVVHEEDERVTIRRVERHRTDATAKLVLEKVSDAAQPRHLAGDAQHKALPGGPDRQSWVAHHPRR